MNAIEIKQLTKDHSYVQMLVDNKEKYLNNEIRLRIKDMANLIKKRDIVIGNQNDFSIPFNFANQALHIGVLQNLKEHAVGYAQKTKHRVVDNLTCLSHIVCLKVKSMQK